MKSIAKTLASATLVLGIGIFGSVDANAVVIDFNDQVSLIEGSIIPILPYVEDGFRLRDGTTSGGNGLFDQDLIVPRSSDYFGWIGGTTFVIESAAGGAFALSSMDLGVLDPTAINPLVPQLGVLDFTIVGHLVGGGTVSMTGTSINLNTVTFDGSWSNLSSVDVTANTPDDGAVDNINVSVVPEPASLALLGLGLAGLGFARRRIQKTA